MGEPQNQVFLFEDAGVGAIHPPSAAQRSLRWSGTAQCQSSPSHRDELLQDPLIHPFPPGTAVLKPPEPDGEPELVQTCSGSFPGTVIWTGT